MKEKKTEIKKKLKSIFSPKKLVLWLSILILIFTVPAFNKSAMSQTQAIVTMLCVDKVDDKIKVAATVLTPSQDKKANFQVYSGEGETLGYAVDSVSLAIGKEMGFAQCKIMALGENICSEGVMQVLDYMTRTKKVGRNAVLVSFTGDVVDFTQAVANLNLEKSLRLDRIVSFDKRYVLTQDSNIETFYIGYYSPISLGIMSKVKLGSSEEFNAIEVASSDSGSAGGASTDMSSTGDGGENKKFIMNDGTVSLFKNGKHYIDMTLEEVKKANIFVNDAQKGTVVVEGVTDHIYNNAKVVVNILKKDISIKPSFKDGIPIYKTDVDLTVFIDEVIEENPSERLLRRNQDFLTNALIAKIKEKMEGDMREIIKYCQDNEVDLLGVYKHFYALENKDFEEYLNRVGEKNYLDGIDYQISIKVKSEN